MSNDARNKNKILLIKNKASYQKLDKNRMQTDILRTNPFTYLDPPFPKQIRDKSNILISKTFHNLSSNPVVKIEF